MQPELWAQFVAALAEQLQVLNDMLDLERKKTEVLLSGNPAELDTLVKGEHVLIWQLGRLEERRFGLQQELAASLGLKPQELTLSTAASLAPARWRARLVELGDRYGAVCADLTTRNEQNRELLKGALVYCDFALNMLHGQAATGTVYSAPGAKEPAPAPRSARILDNRA